MRQLNRNLVANEFPSNFTAEGKKKMELDLLIQTRDKLSGDRERYGFKSWRSAKNNLINESHGKCAYCEVNFTAVAYGDVEHFRPKSKYWWLAYAYVNYAASCQLCNQKYKGKNFPINANMQSSPVAVTATMTDNELEAFAGNLAPDLLNATNQPSLEDYIQKHTEEEALSIDPYIENPTNFFAYEYDDDLREVSIVSLNSSVKEKVESTIKLFGLNRKELLKLRWDLLYQYRIDREFFETSDRPRHREIALRAIRRYSADDAPFSSMISFFNKIAIDYIPLEAEHHYL